MYRKNYCKQTKHKDQPKGTKRSTEQNSKNKPLQSPNSADEGGQTVLHLSIMKYCVEESLFDAALKAGCDVNKCNMMEQTALHLASKKGLSDCVRKLLDHGAKMDLIDKHDMTPLMYAAQNGHPTVIESLAKNGANVNLSNSKGKIALHYSCFGGHSECTELLLKYKSRPNYPDDEGGTPLILACRSNNVLVVQALLDAGANPDKVDNVNRSALHWAALLGNKAIVDALISARASVDIVDKNYLTPFMCALLSDHADVLLSLVNAGCDRAFIDGMDGTALTLASLKGQNACVEVLLSAGEDPDEFSYFGMTALMASVYESHLDVTQTILQHKPNINLTSRLGFTAVFASLCHINEQNAQTRHKLLVLLLQNGADVNQTFGSATAFSNIMKEMNSPLLFAITTGYISLVKILLYAGSKISHEKLENLKITGNDSSICEPSLVLKPIVDYKSNPASLQHICRKKVRQQLDSNVREKLQQLPIPDKLKCYLNFSDLADIMPERAKVRHQFHDMMLSMLDLTVCGLQAIEGSYLCRRVRDAVIQAMPFGKCTCLMCSRRQEQHTSQ